jgi:mercuric ion transport protein
MHPAAMTIKAGKGDRLGYTPALLAAGGLLGALAASSCCILPLVLFALGVSGAWIGNFTWLAAYQSIFLAAAIACLGAGGWLAHRNSTKTCTEGDACARPLPNRFIAVALIAAAFLVVAAIGFDFLGPLLLS